MKRLLIDAAHTEELRVLTADDDRIEDFEAETVGKTQIRGNIYIGHVSRVEPSLQAAFITYGGNRNGFLAFGEVHPASFKLKPAERTALLEELHQQALRQRGLDEAAAAADAFAPALPPATPASALSEEPLAAEHLAEELKSNHLAADSGTTPKPVRGGRRPRKTDEAPVTTEPAPEKTSDKTSDKPTEKKRGRPRRLEAIAAAEPTPAIIPPAPAVKEKDKEKKFIPIHRRFRIQDVLKEGQKILVQVVKEERGSKGAALTTYLSLPGRFTVLMPNTPSAGGISRKITDPEERKALRDAYAGLDIPPTMGMIIRTAGLGQPLAAIKNDYQNLSTLYHSITTAFEENNDVQCLHEDGSLIIRALRDMISDDISEIVIAGKAALKTARDYTRSFMPEAAKLIHEYRDDTPIFTHFGVEEALHQLHHNRVSLPSGGSMVINPTEALVAVDINSGRATQERNIEETALKTNLEACEELARQIRLRDLAGLIVVDFIDMESSGNNRKVEAALKKALKKDRARVQCGHISDFGLMEISRQRLRPSFNESHFITCPHCQGSGHVHSPGTAGLMILRRLEHADCREADRITISTSTAQVLWLLNHQRASIQELEARGHYQLIFKADDTLIAPDHRLELTTHRADGTDSSQLLTVTLREQPELPPELRPGYKNFLRVTPYGEKHSQQHAEKNQDKNHDKQPDKHADKHPERTSEPTRDGHKDGHKKGRRPGRPVQSVEATTPAPFQAPAVPAPKTSSRPPRVVEPLLLDAPLVVEKVALTPDEPVARIVVAPRQPLQIRRQADTDAPDVPLQVERFDANSANVRNDHANERPAKEKRRTPRGSRAAAPTMVATANTHTALTPETPAPTEPKKGSILARLINRAE